MLHYANLLVDLDMHPGRDGHPPPRRLLDHLVIYSQASPAATREALRRLGERLDL